MMYPTLRPSRPMSQRWIIQGYRLRNGLSEWIIQKYKTSRLVLKKQKTYKLYDSHLKIPPVSFYYLKSIYRHTIYMVLIRIVLLIT